MGKHPQAQQINFLTVDLREQLFIATSELQVGSTAGRLRIRSILVRCTLLLLGVVGPIAYNLIRSDEMFNHVASFQLIYVLKVSKTVIQYSPTVSKEMNHVVKKDL